MKKNDRIEVTVILAGLASMCLLIAIAVSISISHLPAGSGGSSGSADLATTSQPQGQPSITAEAPSTLALPAPIQQN